MRKGGLDVRSEDGKASFLEYQINGERTENAKNKNSVSHSRLQSIFRAPLRNGANLSNRLPF